MRRIHILGAAILAPVILAGCAVDPASCDPNVVGNVLTSATCSQQGAFDQRQRSIEGNSRVIFAEIERERIAISNANNRIRQLQAQQQLSASQSSALNRQIAMLNSDVGRLASTGNPQQQAQLRGRIAARKAAINSYAGAAVF